MADLVFVKQHNMVAYLEKTEENADFHQILDFLTSSSINFALTISPTIYASYIEQFWNTTCLKTINSEKQIHANVDGKAVVVSESSVRRDLYLNDEDGTACLTTNEIFENLALMGYEPASDKLTFYKGLFSPQWKYLIHTILHCLSSKSTSWDQFSTNLASAIICLAKGQKFNFSKLIFDGMLRNLDPKKFLMYPRFLQLFLNIQLPNLVIPFNDIHETPKLTKKVFTNMRKPGKGFSGRVTPLFQNMLVPPVVVGEGSEQPPEPQPTPSTAPLEVLSQVTTAAASQPPKDPNTYRRTKRGRNTKVPQSGGSPNKVGDEAINEEMFDSVERAATTASSLEAEQASGNINKTQFTATLNEPFFLELGSGSGPWRQETMGVFDLEKEKDAQAVEILKLKKRVKKLERQRKSSISHPRRRIYRQPIFKDSDFNDLDDLVDEGMAFVQEKDAENQGKIGADDTEVVKGSGDTEAVNTAGEGVSTAAPRTPPTTTIVFDDEDVTMALIKMKEEKAKEKGVAIKDVKDSSRPIRSITTLQPLLTIDPKDKGKGILQETEPVEKTNKKVQGDAQIKRDAEVALRLQVELDEELRARIDANYELAARMTQEEQEKYIIEEKARLLAEFFERRKKQLAAERAEAIRNKPPTKTQLRNLMMTYLKNMGGYKHSQLKGKSYEEIQGLYERQQKRIQDFTPMDSEKEAQKPGKRLKRVAGSYATQKSPKKPKVMKSAKDVTEEEAAEYEKEKEELRLSLKIISNDDSEVDYEPLSRKFPILLGKMEAKDMYVYKLTIADGSSSYHGDIQAFLRRLDRQDLNDLYSCGVHTLFMDGTSMEINMLVEKKYPLVKELLEKMMNLQLEAEEESTMAFELIKFIKSLLEE
ncbi:hypothetical protein Tco_0860772 [Tanacetum coccineum]|uniref:Synaptobrevin, longin-like domain protein n=1 Tax=Tanacetum coccineum TaxID=301880 RepID=A0ABQ5BFV7_9ASTR